jgi:hypothetical protein
MKEDDAVECGGVRLKVRQRPETVRTGAEDFKIAS